MSKIQNDITSMKIAALSLNHNNRNQTKHIFEQINIQFMRKQPKSKYEIFLFSLQYMQPSSYIFGISAKVMSNDIIFINDRI